MKTLGEDNHDWSWSELPQIHRVHEVTIHSFLEKKKSNVVVVSMSTWEFHAKHVICVTDGELDAWWKAFHKHYGEVSSIGMISMCSNNLCC